MRFGRTVPPNRVLFEETVLLNSIPQRQKWEGHLNCEEMNSKMEITSKVKMTAKVKTASIMKHVKLT